MNKILAMALIILFLGLYFLTEPFFSESVCCSISDESARTGTVLFFRLGFIALVLWSIHSMIMGED